MKSEGLQLNFMCKCGCTDFVELRIFGNGKEGNIGVMCSKCNMGYSMQFHN